MKERLKDATTIKVGSHQVNPFLYWRAWLTILTPFVLASVPLTLGSEVQANVNFLQKLLSMIYTLGEKY